MKKNISQKGWSGIPKKKKQNTSSFSRFQRVKPPHSSALTTNEHIPLDFIATVNNEASFNNELE